VEASVAMLVEDAAAVSSVVEAPVAEPVVRESAVAMPSFMLPPVERPEPAPVEFAEPEQAEPVEVAAPELVMEEPVAPAPAPRAFVEMFSQRIADPVNAPAVEPLTVPIPPAVEPIQLPEGMVMIETRAESAAAPAVEETVPEVPRRPRPRAQVAVADEPMQQVETRK
jgi:ribonuclease E